MSKLSLHLQSCPSWVPEFVRRSGVEWIKWIDPPSTRPDWCQGVKVVGRTFEDDGVSNERVWRGAAGAQEWFTKWRPFYLARPWVHCWEGPNEPQPMGDTIFQGKLLEFTIELGDLMHQNGLKFVGMNWGVGWPDIGTAAQFGPAMAHMDYLGLHEYAAPMMQDGNGFLTLRYRKTVQELANAGYTVPPILVTECGIDGGVIGRPKTGWRTWCNNQFACYLDQLKWYSAELDKDNVAAATIFTICDWDWLDFSFGEGEAMQLAEFIASDEPAPQPERARLLDVSQFTGYVDWPQVKAAGYLGVMIRFSGPNADRTKLIVDTHAYANYDGAGAVGLLRGGYHGTMPEPTGQAKFFVDAVGDRMLELGYWGDFEGAVTDDKANTFLVAADRNLALRGIKRPICDVYTGAGWLSGKTATWAAGRDLWLAAWTYDLDKTPAVPVQWADRGWTFWQWDNLIIDLPGIEKRVCVDVYAGTPEQFLSAYGNQEGGEPVGEIRVFDSEGNEKDLAWAIDRYGIDIIQATPPDGETVFRLTELRQLVGPCSMTVKVVDESGQPLEGIAVLQGWVDGDVLPENAAPRLSDTIWAQPAGKPNKGGGGMTNAEGIRDWGWGAGEGYDPATMEGAHWYWVMPGDNQWYTDVILGLGWIWGTDHDTLTLTYTKTTATDDGDDDDDTGSDLTETNKQLKRIADAAEFIAAHWPFK